MGMLNASQVCTNRAAFSLAWMSSVPASEPGWFATIPVTYPLSRPKAQMTLVAHPECTSMNTPSSTISAITSRISYGARGSAGTM